MRAMINHGLGLAAAFVLAGVIPASAQTVAITNRVTVQPILVTSDDGLTHNLAPDLTTFEAAADKIWAQAGIDVYFNPTITYNESDFLALDVTLGDPKSLYKLEEMAFSTGTAPTNWRKQSLGGALADTVVRMFLVQTIEGNAFGFTLQSSYTPADPPLVPTANQTQKVFMAIADTVFTNNRLDTIAHELGHALALEHDFYGAGNGVPLNLMTAGNATPPRSAPTFLGNIYPDGGDYDQLTATQIFIAQEMAISVPGTYPDYNYGAVPEPALSTLLAGAAVVTIGAWVRRRRSLGAG